MKAPTGTCKDSITPSAINSWIGEEVRPVAAEGTLAATLGEHKLRATAALMAANDTAGTLLTFRGWALHDRTTLAFHRQPLPPLDGEIAGIPGAVHPSAARRRIRASRIGRAIMRSSPGSRRSRSASSCSATTTAPIPKRSTRIWNGAGGRSSTMSALVADLGPGAELKAQALQGRTRMGFVEHGQPLDRQPLSLGLRASDASVRDGPADWHGSMPSTRATAAATSAMNMTTAAGRRCSRRKREWGRFHRPRRAAPCVERARGSRRSSGSSRDSARRSSRPNCECTGNHARIAGRLPSLA